MNLSVLNTDTYDRRRWGQILDQSPRLQEIDKEGKKTLPHFSPLMGDMWASLFKADPQVQDEVDSSLLPNQGMMRRLQADEGFQQFRSTTALDDLASAIGTINLSEKVSEWVDDQRQRDKELSDLLQQAFEQQQRRQQGQQEDDSQQSDETMQALQQKLQGLMDQPSFAKALQQGYQETKDSQEGLQTLLGGSGAGDQQGELHKVPLNEKIALADKLKRNPKLKKIAEWAGRFKAIAQKKKRTKSKDSLSRSGVTVGDSVERLLPTELALLQNPRTKLEFYRKFTEKQLMQYEVKGKEELGKGAFILCLDQSSSMRKLDEQSKGFMLALMAMAKKQKRDFAYIPFDSRAKTHLYEKGKITTTQMVELAEQFLDGGTDFIPPLTQALEVVNKSKFKNADIVFVTDGDSTLSSWYKDHFCVAKKELGINVLSILLGSAKKKAVEIFSDKIVMASDFMDEDVLSAFEI